MICDHWKDERSCILGQQYRSPLTKTVHTQVAFPFFVRSRSEKEFQKNINPVICICDNYLHYKWFTNYLLLFFFNKSLTVHINCQRSCHATTLTAANKTICVKCFRTADFACYWKEKLRYILQLMLWTQE